MKNFCTYFNIIIRKYVFWKEKVKDKIDTEDENYIVYNLKGSESVSYNVLKSSP